MIECEIYKDEPGENGEEVPIGDPFDKFKFNSIPRVGDVLWLKLRRGKRISVTVTNVAQWASTRSLDDNMGCIYVKMATTETR